jgi:D-amino-acid dehydrogenase
MVNKEAGATRVIVIGAGIIGACIGYELAKRGAQVTLIDRDEPGRGCSFGNSGAISSGSVAPLAMPGIVGSSIKMMRDPDGPLRIVPSYLPTVMPWLRRFVASSSPEKVEASATALTSLLAGAVQNHIALAREIGAAELVMLRGHLLLYRDAAALAKEDDAWRLRARHGVPFERIDRNGILSLEPAIGPEYTIGIFMREEATVVNPYRYVLTIVDAYLRRGGTLVKDAIGGFDARSAGGWTCRGAQGSYDADHVIVAAGIA